ncbi:Sucrose-6-phosphate hydrolase [Fusarium denticulatum]|uniref:Sucrose-6-phosphate hydrolase n=1 Tax=Fusarium denticulatum TaxID=48507 RepID=A0A8H5XKQ7_9HYPO|nr:Sucrose-6-phosphate hydrolase [Fusarium denticulatum]
MLVLQASCEEVPATPRSGKHYSIRAASKDNVPLQGQKVHVLVHDSSAKEGWGHINVDDIRVGCDALDMEEASLSTSSDRQTKPLRAHPLAPRWINDPASLAEFHGTHHLFSQYYLETPLWGSMLWAHAMSTDAVHWLEQPVALYPAKVTNSSDDSGRFTGSPLVDKKQDELRLVLTDYINLAYHSDAVQESVITATIKDGSKFNLAKEPLIAGPPKGEDALFRDPKVFHDPTDNKWKVAIGATKEDYGQVQLYESGDLVNWTYAGVLHVGDGKRKALEVP